MSQNLIQTSISARATAMVLFGLLYAATVSAECAPGVYDSGRGLRIGDCYVTTEMNAAMKNFGQRTFLLGKRIPMTGRRYKIGGVEYTDRQVVNIQMAYLDDAKKIAAMQEIKSEDGVSEDAAWARLKPVIELSTLNYTRVAEQAMHIRFTTDADNKNSFIVEGNAPVNRLSTEWRVLATIRQPNIVDPEISGAFHEKALGNSLAAQVRKAGERLMLSGALNGQLFFLVRNRIARQHADLYVRKPDGGIEDLGHIAEIEYTDVGRGILKQLSEK